MQVSTTISLVAAIALAGTAIYHYFRPAARSSRHFRKVDARLNCTRKVGGQ